MVKNIQILIEMNYMYINKNRRKKRKDVLSEFSTKLTKIDHYTKQIQMILSKKFTKYLPATTTTISIDFETLLKKTIFK